MAGRRKLLVVVAFAAVSTACSQGCPPKATPTTRLEIEISGGFGYVPTPSDRTLAIAYLNDVIVTEDTDGNPSTPDVEVCNVDQIGTELMVLRGDIIDFQGTGPLPETRIFDLDKAQVSFPKLASANIPLNYTRRTWKPNPLKPASKTDSSWKDLQYVPRIADHAGLTDRTIKQQWRSHPNVNGFVTLRGGTLEGAIPTDPTAGRAEFEYKVGGVSQGVVASTDKTIYRVDVPADQVEILFTGAAKGYKRLVLKPTSPTEAVRLRLRGLHAMDTPASMKDGDELKDFCAFHTLLEPPVASSQYVRIYYRAPPLSPSGDAMPTPGYYCDGNGY